MYTLLYAREYKANTYVVVEKEIQKITLKQFTDRCKAIVKENHPVRFVVLEDDVKGIVAMYRGRKIVMNKKWKK
jgi:hypothetical protein